MRASLALLLVAVSLASCADPPPIAKQAGLEFGDFEHFVPAAFPVGSDARRLNDAMKTEGFKIDGDGHAFKASYVPTGSICGNAYEVSWEVDGAGRIARIRSQGAYCPGL